MNRLKWDGPAVAKFTTECAIVNEYSGAIVCDGVVTYTIVFDTVRGPDTPAVLDVSYEFSMDKAEYNGDAYHIAAGCGPLHLRVDFAHDAKYAEDLASSEWWNEHAADLFTWHEPTQTEPGYWT